MYCFWDQVYWNCGYFLNFWVKKLRLARMSSTTILIPTLVSWPMLRGLPMRSWGGGLIPFKASSPFHFQWGRRSIGTFLLACLSTGSSFLTVWPEGMNSLTILLQMKLPRMWLTRSSVSTLKPWEIWQHDGPIRRLFPSCVSRNGKTVDKSLPVGVH